MRRIPCGIAKVIAYKDAQMLAFVPAPRRIETPIPMLYPTKLRGHVERRVHKSKDGGKVKSIIHQRAARIGKAAAKVYRMNKTGV
ncbi:MAG: hypothetical protein DHS20C08_18520 [Rhodomicrobium sp.]|nr:MAG: hypothetical protein DHS20C08_18520 [Rhodomicrobium sp.]